MFYNILRYSSTDYSRVSLYILSKSLKNNSEIKNGDNNTENNKENEKYEK